MAAVLSRLHVSRDEPPDEDNASVAFAVSDMSDVPCHPGAKSVRRCGSAGSCPVPELVAAQPRFAGDQLNQVQRLPLRDAHGEELRHDA